MDSENRAPRFAALGQTGAPRTSFMHGVFRDQTYGLQRAGVLEVGAGWELEGVFGAVAMSDEVRVRG